MIQCGGVLISLRNIITGDKDCVIVVPKDEGEEVLKRARELLTRERNYWES
jgi:regulator of RNase E activity RraA